MSELKWPHQIVVSKSLMKVGSKEYEVWKQELNDAYKRTDEAMKFHLNDKLLSS